MVAAAAAGVAAPARALAGLPRTRFGRMRAQRFGSAASAAPRSSRLHRSPVSSGSLRRQLGCSSTVPGRFACSRDAQHVFGLHDDERATACARDRPARRRLSSAVIGERPDPRPCGRNPLAPRPARPEAAAGPARAARRRPPASTPRRESVPPARPRGRGLPTIRRRRQGRACWQRDQRAPGILDGRLEAAAPSRSNKSRR